VVAKPQIDVLASIRKIALNAPLHQFTPGVATMSSIETLSEHMQFGGIQGFYRHVSTACAAPMRFGVFRPSQSRTSKVPALYCLAGLTCSEETFAIKAGAQRMAAELGLMLITPDTSPRNTGIPDEAADWEVGTAAGFYLNSTQPAWSKHFNMYSYVSDELPAIVAEHFPADPQRRGIMGHSMGGHGALTIALKRIDQYRSVSAFAPIVAPSQVPWGHKAFSRFLGEDRAAWSDYDATELVKRRRFPGTILIDQGESDKFLAEQLRPQLFEEACRTSGQDLRLRRHAGYDHSYYFISTFVDDHLRHHAAELFR
jgi:S-formylglutathione hydrolase